MLRSFLTLTGLVLSAAVYVFVLDNPPAPAASGTALDPATTAAIGTPAPPAYTRELAPLAALNRTVEQPLFSPTRRPGVEPIAAHATTAPAEQAVVPAVASPGFSLTAVFRSADIEVALLSDSATGRASSVRVGEEFGGWRVTAIEAQSVVLAKDDARYTLALREPVRGRANRKAVDLRVTPPAPAYRLRSAPTRMTVPALPEEEESTQ